MNNEYYSKFLKFLKEKKIYEEKSFKYFLKQATFIESNNNFDNIIGHCTCVYDKGGLLIDIIPCTPFITDEKSVVININAYVQTLMLIPKIGTKYNEDVFYNYVLPLFYEKLYITENYDKVLSKYEKRKKQKILKGNNSIHQFAFKYSDELLEDYLNKNSSGIDKVIAVSRRTARDYLKKKEYFKKKKKFFKKDIG